MNLVHLLRRICLSNLSLVFMPSLRFLAMSMTGSGRSWCSPEVWCVFFSLSLSFPRFFISRLHVLFTTWCLRLRFTREIQSEKKKKNRTTNRRLSSFSKKAPLHCFTKVPASSSSITRLIYIFSFFFVVGLTTIINAITSTKTRVLGTPVALTSEPSHHQSNHQPVRQGD